MNRLFIESPFVHGQRINSVDWFLGVTYSLMLSGAEKLALFGALLTLKVPHKNLADGLLSGMKFEFTEGSHEATVLNELLVGTTVI